jgi:hypothetical protein
MREVKKKENGALIHRTDERVFNSVEKSDKGALRTCTKCAVFNFVENKKAPPMAGLQTANHINN